MATIEELQKDHEQKVRALLAQIGGRGQDSDWAAVRALVHQALHFCAERKAGEFCAVATLLAEMTTHAHGFMHGGSEAPASVHGDVVH